MRHKVDEDVSTRRVEGLWATRHTGMDRKENHFASWLYDMVTLIEETIPLNGAL